MSNSKVYDIVNEKILDQLKEGNIPWQKPWVSTADGKGPRNLVSGKPYRGINAFLLACDTRFTSPYWVTYKQCQERGGQVRKGEKSTLVTFWKLWTNGETVNTAKGPREKVLPLLRYYLVFNVEQCEGLEYPKPDNTTNAPAFNPIEEAERIAAAYVLGPKVFHQGQQAFYRPSTDEVFMPAKESFIGPAEYYSTLFHELTHSTGHARRLNRDGFQENAGHVFGSENYSKEELIAEFGAAFLCASSGINNTVRNSAAYIQNWMKVIKNNKTWLVHAAANAQKAADLIQGIQHTYAEHTDEKEEATAAA